MAKPDMREETTAEEKPTEKLTFPPKPPTEAAQANAQRPWRAKDRVNCRKWVNKFPFQKGGKSKGKGKDKGKGWKAGQGKGSKGLSKSKGKGKK